VAKEPQAETGRRDALRGFAHIGAGTLVSRLSGFAREVTTAAFFGAGTAMDVFVAAFTIPNLLCRILGETALESAFMPFFKGIHARGAAGRAWRLAGNTAFALVLVLIAIVVVGIAAAPLLVEIVAHGFTGDVAASTVRMTRLMFPFGLLIGLAALMGSILLAFRRYRVYSLAPVLLNVGIIGAVVGLSRRLDVVSLAVGVLLGGLLQFLVQVPFAARLARADGSGLFARRPSLRDEDVRQVGRLAGPVVVASAIQRVGVIVDRTIASFLAPGSISSLYYAFRLVHLPYAILALAAGRAVAPDMAERYALGESDGFRRSLLEGLRMNVVSLVPVVVLSVWYARPVVGLVYERGAFDATDLAMTSSAFALYAVGLVSMGFVFVLVRGFAARLDTRTPVRISLLAFVANVVLNLVLVRTPLRHAGLALASSLAFTIHAAVLYGIMNRRLACDGVPIGTAEIAGPFLRCIVAAGALAAAVWAADLWTGPHLAGNLFVGRLARIAAGSAAGGVAYIAVGALLGIEEIRRVLARVARRRATAGGGRRGGS